MATFLDVTGLKHFSSIFVFLFVWLVVFATLSWSKVLGENKFVITLVGLLLGVFTLLSPIATDVVASTAPYLAVVFVFIVLINVASKMLGGADVEAFPALRGVFLILIIIIIIVAVGVKIREQVDVPSETQQDLSKTINLIFHPTFLGTVLILAIAVFTIALLASRSA
ncbi:hypothetical protein HYX00_04695 [Candidatus Woesearchaeota archaeon]|nr:hypothetical protein [Candidatus Woesearchaeota archaeon]